MPFLIALLIIAALGGFGYLAYKNPSQAKAAVAWAKDHAPAFTVSFVTFSALWAAVVLACLTLYVWDASFYRSLAPPGMELTFQSAGVVFRTFVIFGGLAIIWIKQTATRRAMEEAKFLWIKYQRPAGTDFFGKAGITLRVIWTMGLVACGIAALGFVTEGNDYHYRSNAAIGQTEAATTDSADATISRAETEKAAIRADRDGLVAAARQSMNLVLDDGNAKNDDVSQYEANIAKYQTEAEAKLAIQDAVIAKATEERLAAKRTATAEAVGDPALPAVFQAPARYVAGFDGLIFRDLFAIFWVILIEACGSIGAQALLAVQMALSKRKAAQAAGAQGGKTTARRNRVRGKLKAIEDLRNQPKPQTQADLDEDAPEDPDLDDLSDDFTEEEQDDDRLDRRPPQAAE